MEKMGKNSNFLMGLGAAFYPEHHREETWKEYIRLAGELGLKAVRIGEFAWDKMEPEEGKYDFSWLDRVFSLLAGENIQVILCTPTAVPPIWACERYPEIFPVLENNQTFGFGIRRYTCPTSSLYRRLSVNIVQALAEHFGKNKQLFAWQIDNELGHPFCFCSRCLTFFRQWCQKKYRDIDTFNQAMVLSFWGQTLKSFEQIQFPNISHHPGLWQAYHQFFSEVTIDCFRLQVETLRKYGVTAPITTNMMLTWHGYNHQVFGRYLDVIAGDHYGLDKRSIFAIGGDLYVDQSFVHAFLRGIKNGQPPWFLEFQWGRGEGMPLPGSVRWSVLTQAGLGTKFISFFRFDTCASGQERNRAGLVEVSLKPGRIYREVKRLVPELNLLGEKLESAAPVKPEVAILYTYQNHCEFARNQHPDFFSGVFGNGYCLHLTRHFAGLVKQNILVEVTSPDSDWAEYPVLIVPACFILPETLGKKIISYVENGGTLVMMSYSGLADENGRIWDVPCPAHLTEVLGVEIKDYGRWQREIAGPVSLFSGKRRLPAEILWLEEIDLIDTSLEILAWFKNPFLGKKPALTKNSYGKGKAFYFGAVLEEKGYEVFYRYLARILGLKPVLSLPSGIYATRWQKDRETYLFLNNPTRFRRLVNLKGEFEDLLTGRRLRKISLSPFGVKVLRQL